MDCLLLYNNLAPFQRYCSFFALVTPPIFDSNFGGVLFSLHQIAHIGYSSSRSLKVFGRVIIFAEVFQPITYVITVPERYRRTERFGRSRSSKVIDFGTNRKKRVCDFLLVRHGYLWSYHTPFGRYCRFFVLLSDPTPIPPYFWGVSVASDGPCLVQPALRP